jgi:uncharacterized HAD superfamily protein
MLAELGYSRVREQIIKFEGFLMGKRMAFDIDGTDFATPQFAVDLYNRRYNQRKTIDDLTEAFVMNKWLEKPEGKKAPQVAWEIWHSPEVLTNVTPVSGAVELSLHLHNIGINPPRITSRPAFTRDWTLDSYRRWMPWVKPENIIMQAEGGNEINHHHKVDSIDSMEIEIFFEDNPDHAKEIVEKTKALVVMIPWRWNMSSTIEHPRIICPWNQDALKSWDRRGSIYTAYNALAHHFEFI